MDRGDDAHISPIDRIWKAVTVILWFSDTTEDMTCEDGLEDAGEVIPLAPHDPKSTVGIGAGLVIVLLPITTLTHASGVGSRGDEFEISLLHRGMALHVMEAGADRLASAAHSGRSTARLLDSFPQLALHGLIGPEESVPGDLLCPRAGVARQVLLRKLLLCQILEVVVPKDGLLCHLTRSMALIQINGAAARE